MIPSLTDILSSNRPRTTLLAAMAAACTAGIASAANDATLSLVPSSLHVEAGSTLDVAVHMHLNASPAPALIGAQVVLRFDPAVLEPANASMVAAVGDGPLPSLNPGCIVDPTMGAICFFVLDPTFSGLGGFSGDLAMLHFRVKQGVESCAAAELVRFAVVDDLTTTLAALPPNAPTADFVNLPVLSLDRTAPTLHGVPAAITVPADAGTTAGAAVVNPGVTATDACDPSVPVHILVTLPGGQNASEWPARFPVGTSTVRWQATDDTGHTTTASRTVTVQNHQLMDATVLLQGTFDRDSLGFDRVIRFKMGSAVQLRTVSFDPISRSGSVADLEVPVAAAYPCVTAKDGARSLGDTASATVAGTKYSADFSLVLGDSNDDDLVDVIDFTYFVFDLGVAAIDARSNFNADGFVNNADFSYIAVNFFKVGQSCGAYTGGQPRGRITVKELRRMGLGHLAIADLNRDGVVDSRDIQNHLAGVRPEVPHMDSSEAPPIR